MTWERLPLNTVVLDRRQRARRQIPIVRQTRYPQAIMRQLPGDGLIVRPMSGRFVRRILSLGVPAVGIGSVRIPALKLPRVKVDDEELMRTAAAHLLGGGLRRFAYCGFFPSKN